MKCESLEFSDRALRNVLIRGDSKVLQLCLKRGQAIAKRRVPDSAMMVVVSGTLSVTCSEHERVLRVSDAVLIQPAEEHALTALEDSVVLLILLRREQDRSRVDGREESEDKFTTTRKEPIATNGGLHSVDAR